MQGGEPDSQLVSEFVSACKQERMREDVFARPLPPFVILDQSAILQLLPGLAVSLDGEQGLLHALVKDVTQFQYLTRADSSAFRADEEGNLSPGQGETE